MKYIILLLVLLASPLSAQRTNTDKMRDNISTWWIHSSMESTLALGSKWLFGSVKPGVIAGLVVAGTVEIHQNCCYKDWPWEWGGRPPTYDSVGDILFVLLTGAGFWAWESESNRAAQDATDLRLFLHARTRELAEPAQLCDPPADDKLGTYREVVRHACEALPKGREVWVQVR